MTKRLKRVTVPISIGELIDKVTILQIKASQIDGSEKHGNVVRELALLTTIMTEIELDVAKMRGLSDELRKVNITLWENESAIRELEAQNDFGSQFIALARSIYLNNDRRSQIKRKIDETFSSDIVEEKYYNRNRVCSE